MVAAAKLLYTAVSFLCSAEVSSENLKVTYCLDYLLYSGQVKCWERHWEMSIIVIYIFFKKNLNASRPSEHPSVRGENVKTLKWDHRLQRRSLFMAFKRVLLLW